MCGRRTLSHSPLSLACVGTAVCSSHTPSAANSTATQVENDMQPRWHESNDETPLMIFGEPTAFPANLQHARPNRVNGKVGGAGAGVGATVVVGVVVAGARMIVVVVVVVVVEVVMVAFGAGGVCCTLS